MKAENYCLVFGWILCLILILFLFLVANESSMYPIESFTPTIRGWYRPFIRHSRIHYDTIYHRQKKNVSILLRKMGIL